MYGITWANVVLRVKAHMHTYMCTYVHAYICAHVCTYTLTRARTYVHTYIETYVHEYIRTYVHTYTRTCVHTYIRTYMLPFGQVTKKHLKNKRLPSRMRPLPYRTSCVNTLLDMRMLYCEARSVPAPCLRTWLCTTDHVRNTP